VVNPVLAPPSIGKDFSPNPIAAGGTSVLTFTITNPNPDTALTGVGFSDDFPAGLTVASVPDMAQCGGSVTSTPDSASVTLAGGTIGAGQSCTVVVSVTAPSGGAYTNTSGQVSSTNGGPGNTATDTLDVLGPPQIGKAFNPNSISAGGTSLLTFTIMNPSANPLALSGVGFTDELPAGVTVASPPASPQCAGTVTNTSDSITLSGGTIAVNSSCTVQVTVTAAFGGTYVNTSGAVASANGGTGNTATDTLYVAGAGLTLQKTISTPTYQHADDTLSYTYTLTNTGDRTLYGPFEVQDNLIGVFGCGAATYLDVNTQTSCTASYTVKPGDVAAGSVQNTATATGWGTQSQTSPVTSNPSSATAYLEALTLTKHTSTVGYQTAGNTISYSYTLTNTGPVTLYWPFYVSDDHINNEAQFTCSSATILAPYANISCDAPSLYTVLPGDVTKGSVTNTATATAQDAPAGGRTVTSPPSSVTVYKIVAPSIRKAFSPNPIAVGQSSILTFTITGPSTNKVALTGVGFTDAFPAGLMVTTAPSSLQCGGSVTSTSTSITLHSGTVVPGGTCTVTVSVTAGSGGSYQNTSGPVTSSNGGTGNTASDTLTVVAPPTIGKSFAPGAIVLGGKSTLTFALTAPAGNTVPLAGVTFTDDLPTNLVVSTPPSGITADCGTPTFSPAAGATTLSFTSGTIQAGGTCTVTVSVTALAAGTYNNATGAVRSSNGGTGAPSNIATLTVNPSADLSITKNDGLTGVNRGATVTYVIVVRNAGPSTVVGASVTDTVPSSLLGATWTCVADPGASCTSSGSGNINDTVTIPVGKKVIYRLTATVSSTAATLIVNTASVLPPSGVTDSNLSNNSATDTDYLNRSPNACEISGIVFYDANTNGVFDSGDAVLSGVTITLLDQYGHVLTATATGSGGNYSFDNLLPGTYTVVQTNPAGYPINTTLDHVSVVLAPGTSAVVDFGDQKSTGAAISDPAVTKYASPTVARIGDTVTYTITVGNNGATDASNVNLSDTLPSFLDVVSITILPNPSLPVTIAGNTFTIQFGTVTPTDYYTVIVVTKVNGSAHPPGGVNTASITTTSPGDLLFNDSASAYLTIVAHRVLPATGFAPGRVTVLPAQADAGQKANSGMTIEIPTLGLNTAVVGVPESGDSWDITWLGNDVGYLEGTAFPTWSGNSVLTGHVYGANGLPGPFVNLKSLKWGDQLIILFGAQRYIYEVQTNKVVAPDDTSAFGHKDLPWLTLVTCKDYNPLTNTYAHRVAVGAVLVKIESDPATASPGAALPGP
jgi:LPXTG-site transpeptidase (sortase) family protein